MSRTFLSLIAAGLVIASATEASAQDFGGFGLHNPGASRTHPGQLHSNTPTLDLSAPTVHLLLGHRLPVPEIVTGAVTKTPPSIKTSPSRHRGFFFSWPRHNRTWPPPQRPRRYHS